ncbi:uncharacterized protein LOC125228051 [Leguminivora glycinivorella]|uniref:uncharacterized protein LOC125228051 n=1 Tax=Leguminivora glycinivorella TaxID=1035111 RepID=UPI00200E7C46|nr:uncharacterized protein LOC125228051 [Leguminivora glycinivorella]
MAKRFAMTLYRLIIYLVSFIWRPLNKMEILKKERSVARRLFTIAKSEINAILESANIDDITAAFNKLQLRADSLFNVDQRIKEQWLKTDEMTEDEIYEDCMTSDKYITDWERIKVMYDSVSRKNERVKRSRKSSGSDVSNNTDKSHQCCEKSTCSTACHTRRFRLPKFELRKFDGNSKNWIGFWCQFQKIHDDETIDDGDKFQYLYQCTVPDTPAREIVESFPPSGANYKKAIEQLKSRFARDEMLIDIYVRELLNLVLAQAKGNTSYKLGHLYDKLNTQLLALQSLGVTIDKYAALLFPLVESALPESVLRAWQRSHATEEKGDDHLNRLMKFLKREVESEERIQLARSGIASGDSLHSVPTQQPTAACFVSTEDAGKRICCVWCEKASHSSFECYKANKMSYEARKEVLNKKGACLICLKPGHNAKKCKNFTKCLFCSKRHSVLMCPDIKTSSQIENVKNSNVGTSNLSNNVTQYKASTTLLQTFMANIVSDNKCIQVRCFIDSGAQKTYLRRDIIESLGLKPIGNEIVSNCLFGGIETEKELFHTYAITLGSLDKKFQCTMTARGKSTLCGHVPRLNINHEMFKELQRNNITLSDVGDAAAPDIGLLIGADHAGALLTKSFLELNNNLVAIKTKFGWTLQGPIITNACSVLTNVVLVNNLQISELWDLETLGIRDPAEVANKAKTDTVIMDQFRDSIKINDEGRYEVDLPWKPNLGELLDDKHLAEKRLMSTTQKLEKLKEFDNYGHVFEDWLNDGIIEEVDDASKPKHYLCHHAVIKNTSLTTRVRPVFDAPLTYVADNSDKLKPITPACFTQGLPSSEIPDLDQLDHDSLNRRLRYLHKLREDLRERFRNEYIGMLIQKGKERDSHLRRSEI